MINVPKVRKSEFAQFFAHRGTLVRAEKKGVVYLGH